MAEDVPRATRPAIVPAVERLEFEAKLMRLLSDVIDWNAGEGDGQAIPPDSVVPSGLAKT